MKHAVQHLHFVGIGGAGMSGIAEILHLQGYTVSGSDLVASATTARLAAMGLRIFAGHAAAQIDGAQAVVISGAVGPDNPEVVAARERQIPVLARAAMLAELMRGRRGIAIAGTHGKTTTSALVASVLQQAGADPSWVIGGRPQGTASNARLGGGDTLVVEADESDASFLLLSPVVAVVTNIDADHMQTYGHDLGRLHAAFVDFVHRLPFYGRAIVCTDDAGVRAVLSRLERPCIRYGMHADADLRATQVQAGIGGGMRFVALRRGAADLPVALNLAGEHNVRNALAAIGVAMALGLPDGPVLQALASFGGVGRRFERHGELAAAGGGHYTLIDDYGHHPVEIGAVLEAARAAFPSRRIVIAFQPHRYSRTRDCFDDFVAVLGRFDAVLLTEVYAAGEVPVQGADAASLLRALRAASAVDAELIDDVARLPAAICRSARAGDVVITMGAGSIGAVAGQLEQMQELAP